MSAAKSIVGHFSVWTRSSLLFEGFVGNARRGRGYSRRDETELAVVSLAFVMTKCVNARKCQEEWCRKLDSFSDCSRCPFEN